MPAVKVGGEGCPPPHPRIVMKKSAPATPTPAPAARWSTTRDGDASTGVPASASVTESQMRMVLDISRMLAVPTDLDALLVRLAEACTELLACERASIFLHDPKTG